MANTNTLKTYLESAQAGPLPGETEQQFRDRIAAAALAIQGKLDINERSPIAEPQTFDEISTPGSTPQADRFTAAERENFKALHSEALKVTRDRNRKIVMACVAGLAIAGTVAAGGAPSLGAIVTFATKALGALFADDDGVDADDTEPDIEVSPP